MIAEEMNSPEENTYSVEQRHHYRYNEVDLKGKQYLAKKSCKVCHGTGICGWVMEDQARKIPRQMIRCSCLIQTHKEIEDAKKA